MGWFDDEEIFHAEVITAKLFEEEVDPIKNAVATAIFTGGDQHNFIMAAHYNSLTLLLNRYLAYARDLEKYPPGLPTSKVLALAIADELIQPIIEAEVGEPVVIVSARAGNRQLLYSIYVYLQDNYNWNFYDNVATITGTDYNYIDYEIEKYIHTIITNDGPIYEVRETGYVFLNFKATAGNTTYQEKWYFGLYHEDLWLHVEYTIVSEDQGNQFRPHYWMYNSSTDTTYPELNEEELTQIIEIPSEYYPIITLMREGDFVPAKIEDPNDATLEIDNPEYLASDGLLSKIHLGMEDLIDAISGEDLPEEDKPDLDNLDDINFLFGVNVYTEVEASIEYLYYFLEMLSEYSIIGYTAYQDSLNSLTNGEYPAVNYYEISEDDFNIALQYNYMVINKDVINEGDPLTQKFTKTITINPRIVWKYDTTGDGGIYPDLVIDSSRLSIKKRTGTNTYDEYIIVGPVMRTKVRALGESKKIYRYLRDVDNTEDRYLQGFFFPVSFTIANKLTIIHKDIMIYDSMMLAIYAADIEVVKWYQTGIFKILLQIVVIVAVVILTLTFGPGSLTLMNVVVNSLLAMVTSFAVSIALDLLVEAIGGKLATILVILVILIKAYTGNFAGFADLPFAEQLLKATQLIVDITNTYTKISVLALQDEVEEFLKDVEDRQDEIDAANDMLAADTDSGIDPLYVIQSIAMMSAYENPADFYERTIHIGNPGVLSLDAIETYADNKLRLPEFDPTSKLLPA